MFICPQPDVYYFLNTSYVCVYIPALELAAGTTLCRRHKHHRTTHKNTFEYILVVACTKQNINISIKHHIVNR